VQALPNPSHFDANVADEDGSVLLNEPRENRTLRTLLLHKIQGLLDEADDQKCRCSCAPLGRPQAMRVLLITAFVGGLFFGWISACGILPFMEAPRNLYKQAHIRRGHVHVSKLW
jgi:hypothetical protein